MTYPKGSRGECLQHSRIRCGECEYVADLEQKIELERNMNKNLADLNSFLQVNPDLSKSRYGESVSLIAMDALKTLKEENECYKQALEFYADKKTYNLGVQFSMGTAHPKHEPIKFDNGEKARKALKEVKV